MPSTPLTKSETIIGRVRAAVIVSDDACVSKRHAMLKLGCLREGGGVEIEVLNSTNGTRVNSMEVIGVRLMQNDDVDDRRPVGAGKIERLAEP